MSAYYNEFDPYAAQWLRNLISKNLIAPGDVDERSIVDVHPDDLRGYTQCHFFAGIGGWSYALRLAGWSDDRAVWTGSCPCQPLSLAGKQKGHADERHLWPAFHDLIEERCPAEVFGEQVASPDGREWFAGVRADLEDLGYACGAADLCAAGIGAPHPRQRLYWVAYLDQAGRGHASPRPESAERHRYGTDGLGRWIGHWDRDGEQSRFADGSTRRTKSGVGIMVDGFPGRVDAVGAFGNAIVPQLAAEFISASVEARP
ncbi:methyltransferase [Neorhizobium sp. SOG26]|uniref:DNA cytosine methyltransferase n=1 Tax=Neorhizobium sp. SOG26 TaxID=2060726 RepID=UPI000E568310|nr:DNA cytosine methyltransferase [Neorhizobium sp. SOG26]AXV15103.1 methyltransferase [Neorhizobium sp. SOG26]